MKLTKKVYTEDGKLDDVAVAKARFSRLLEKSKERSLRNILKEERNSRKAKRGKKDYDKKKKKKRKKNKKEKQNAEDSDNEIDGSFKYWFSQGYVNEEVRAKKTKPKTKSRRNRIKFKKLGDKNKGSKDVANENSMPTIEHTERTWSSSFGSNQQWPSNFSLHMKKITEDGSEDNSSISSSINSTIDTTDHTSSRHFKTIDTTDHVRTWWVKNQDTAPKTPRRNSPKAVVFPMILSTDCESSEDEDISDDDISMIDDDETSVSDGVFDELSCVLAYESDTDNYPSNSRRSLYEDLLKDCIEDESMDSQSFCTVPPASYVEVRKRNSKTKDNSETQGELVVTSPRIGDTGESNVSAHWCRLNSYKRIGMDGSVLEDEPIDGIRMVKRPGLFAHCKRDVSSHKCKPYKYAKK
jgi:hypothetical protein